MFEEREQARKVNVSFIQLLVVLLVASFVRFLPSTDLKWSGVAILGFLHLTSFYVSNTYQGFDNRGYLEEALAVLRYSIVYALGISFLSFMLEENFIISRRGLVYFIILNTLAIYACNLAIKRYRKTIYPRLKSSRKLLLITDNQRFDKTWQQLRSLEDRRGSVVAVSLVDAPQIHLTGVDTLRPDQVIPYATRSVVDEIIINLPSDHYDVQEWVSQIELMGIDVTLVINSFDFATISEKRVQNLSGLNVVTFSTKFYRYSHVISKRILDILGSLFGLLICGLVAIFVVPLIRKDGGPAIFVQKRVGQNGRIFHFYKFRSMYVDAEERKKELLSQNTMHGGMFKMDNDPRITPIGAFLRKTSLDELPQFWNVLKGDMSLVGTRPPTLDEYESYTPAQKRRLSFKPGITGLWQVSGRSEITNFDDVVALDVAYIDGWTIWSDVKILLKTLGVVFLGRGAK